MVCPEKTKMNTTTDGKWNL